jgi:LytS/YehU family sensor histidine kinase
MYETRHETVPLQGEMEFMRNYVELMKLRHNDKLKVTTEWPDTPPSTLHLPPLLFISLIENAFKHGVSSNRDSRIDISLTADNDQITFSCNNTNYPKDEQNRSGSGIGIENTRRRLDLMYPGRYTWDYGVNDDGTEYHSCITINGK